MIFITLRHFRIWQLWHSVLVNMHACRFICASDFRSVIVSYDSLVWQKVELDERALQSSSSSFSAHLTMVKCLVKYAGCRFRPVQGWKWSCCRKDMRYLTLHKRRWARVAQDWAHHIIDMWKQKKKTMVGNWQCNPIQLTTQSGRECFPSNNGDNVYCKRQHSSIAFRAVNIARVQNCPNITIPKGKLSNLFLSAQSFYCP